MLKFTPRLIDSLTRDLPVEKGELDPLGGGTDVSARGYDQSLDALAVELLPPAKYPLAGAFAAVQATAWSDCLVCFHASI